MAQAPPRPSVGFRAVVRTRARDWDRTAAPLHVFGGTPLLEAALPVSRVTRRAMQLTLDLDLSDARLAGLGLQGLRRLAVPATYEVETDGKPLIVRHVDAGARLELLAEPEGSVLPPLPGEIPQLPVDLVPLTEAEEACETFDDVPEPHGPLHQVGGHPLWVSAPVEPPTCPVTGDPMRFIACIDSELRFPFRARECALLFGDCGALYVYWSDAASASACVVSSS